MSFLSWLRSLFAKLGSGAVAAADEGDGDSPPRLSPARELPPEAPASTRASEGTPAPGDIEDFDLTQGCEYAAAERGDDAIAAVDDGRSGRGAAT